ncbi:phage tail tape measure protein [Clostridium sp. 'White wine YQ']|uniref:phage tail tape measure protein n=1 Tax=Clostridium sp. 'White wine YQ' TaxID=3027474 RepID=UPI0023666FAF|nr:phage tail tape measure protein [Clostridium sp. 'White wine YQ']MDD7793699.1 phage tail tape measure protein [Clostridium sp. 'White wine YQ']
MIYTADGKIIIDTEIDNSGVQNGIDKLSSSTDSGAKVITQNFKSASMSIAKDFEDSAEEAKKSVSGLSEETKTRLSDMANTAKIAIVGGFAAIGSAILGASVTTVKLGEDYQKASNTLQTQTGATADEMDKLNEAMTNVYGNNFGESMQDVANSMATVRTYLQGTGEDIQGATENAIAFRDTFGVEVPESMRSVTTLMNQFGITSEEAFNLLAQGQQQNLNFSDELYDSVNEYSVQFKKLGLNAEDMFNIFNDGAIDGAFNLDKIGDAVKEFSIRAIDGSKTTQEGFQALGFSADDMAKRFATGGDTARDAFVQVTEAIANMDDPVQQSIVGVKLFGTMWEDLGPQVVSQLGNIGDNYNRTIDTMNKINQIKYNSFGEALKGIGRQIQTELLLPIAKDVLPSLNEMANQFKATFSSKDIQASIKNISNGLSDIIKNVAGAAQDVLPKLLNVFAWILDNTSIISAGLIGIATAMGVMKVAFAISAIISAYTKAVKDAAAVEKTLTVTQWLLNAAMDANPIGIVVGLIAGLVAAVIYLWNTNEGFRNAVISAWNAVLEAGQFVWGEISTLFTETIPSAFQFVLDTIVQWGATVSNFFTSTIPTWISNIFTWFNELPYLIGLVLGYVLASIVKWGIDTFNYLTTNVPIWISSIGTWFSTLPGIIWAWLVNAYNNIVTWGVNTYNNMIQSASNAINGVISWFSQLPSRVWSWLINTISRVADFGSNLGAKASEAGSNMVSNIINAVVGLPSRMSDIGANIVRGVWNGIVGLGGWLASKVSGFFSGIVDGAKAALGIHSPSRVFRDQVGKYMAQGVGVGFEDESKDVQKDMQDNLLSLTAKLQTTVDYETSRTSTAVAAKNTYKESSTEDNSGSNGIPEGSIFILKNDIDGKTLGETVYKVVDGKLAVASRRKRG